MITKAVFTNKEKTDQWSLRPELPKRYLKQILLRFYMIRDVEEQTVLQGTLTVFNGVQTHVKPQTPS